LFSISVRLKIGSLLFADPRDLTYTFLVSRALVYGQPAVWKETPGATDLWAGEEPGGAGLAAGARARSATQIGWAIRPPGAWR
jgi:hypothetical protein